MLGLFFILSTALDLKTVCAQQETYPVIRSVPTLKLFVCQFLGKNVSIYDDVILSGRSQTECSIRHSPVTLLGSFDVQREKSLTLYEKLSFLF